MVTISDVRKVKIKNTSGGVITVKGKRFENNEERLLTLPETFRWANDEHVLGLVTSGTLQVIDDTDDSTYDASDSKPAVEFMTDAVGKVYQIGFGSQGLATNKWLDVGHTNPSNEVPHVIPHKSCLMGMTFSNSVDGGDADIEVYRAADGAGNSDTLVHTWEIRNSRTAWKTDAEVVFNPGDKVAVFVRDQGTNVRDVEANLYLLVIANTIENDSEDWTGDF